jgi:hypothetical protein
MHQRLYFLLPDRAHTLKVVNELAEQGFDPQQMHTLARKGLSMQGLPTSNYPLRNDFAGRIEFWLWRANLALFFLAAGVLALLIFRDAGFWVMLPLALMVVTFILGERFSRQPNAHLREFRDALRHGEILLMVDVPRERVNEVEYRVQSRHPEVVVGGSSWNSPALGI